MKRLFAFVIITLSVYLKADAQTTKIHFFNASGRGKTLRLQPSAATKNTITIRSSHWAVIQINSDSLGFLTSDQPYFLHFERGKNYYFIAQADYMPVFVVKETSEREFLLTVLANNSGKPEEYSLDN